MERKLIPEMFALRSIACLCLVFRNSTNRAFPESSFLGNFFELLLTFGTPAFVFISEMILARSYREAVDRSFWEKRIKYILAPYFLFGAFYAVMKSVQSWAESGEFVLGTLVTYLWRHVLIGDYHGYFILIIFQFYALHSLMRKFDSIYSPLSVVLISFAINITYLGFFNFIPSPEHPVMQYIWAKFYWIPFPGWLLYYVVAYYCGTRYEAFKEILRKYGHWSLLAVPATAALCWLALQYGWIEHVSSKRIDMLFFTISVIFLICYIVSRVKKVPSILVGISRYSFGIYLLHPLFLAMMIIPLQMLRLTGWLTASLLFFGCVGCSMVAAHVLNLTKWGPYFVGKIGKSEREQNKRHYSAVAIDS
ncbi:hypothetical protein FE784_09015 [Paenibacillus hemerocallicola]|uniref:Acyltransferase 3 domain-containing protein n=1 Tax=Paenibacillus hemerocallicola TaxID=1172614 RepID=A0A5C4TDJ5_9BACL|nr:acyltransferase family protein [Paenibacillus hemerocallicola]TNJ66696.1 hypothetical protein FE784_09015 [Paenibacillus hemerocallicola]